MNTCAGTTSVSLPGHIVRCRISTVDISSGVSSNLIMGAGINPNCKRLKVSARRERFPESFWQIRNTRVYEQDIRVDRQSGQASGQMCAGGYSPGRYG